MHLESHQALMAVADANLRARKAHATYNGQTQFPANDENLSSNKLIARFLQRQRRF